MGPEKEMGKVMAEVHASCTPSMDWGLRACGSHRYPGARGSNVTSNSQLKKKNTMAGDEREEKQRLFAAFLNKGLHIFFLHDVLQIRQPVLIPGEGQHLLQSYSLSAEYPQLLIFSGNTIHIAVSNFN